MPRTKLACKALTPKVNVLDEEIEKLTDYIECFEESEIQIEVFDDNDLAQKDTKETYFGFPKTIAEVNDDYCDKASDIEARLEFIKQVAEETSPLLNFRLKELEHIIENVGQKNL